MPNPEPNSNHYTAPGDFFSWMRGPMKEILEAGDANVGCGTRARSAPQGDSMAGGLGPTFCTQDNSPTSFPVKVQVWMLTGCTLRQVRVKPQPVEGTSMSHSKLVTHYLPDYAPEYLDTSVRSWYNDTYTEGYLENTYKNRYKLEKDTPDFTGSRLIGATYPGQAGQIFMGDLRPNKTGSTGWWYGTNSIPGNLGGSNYDADVTLMEEGWWIDERTRMVQMSCKGINANTDQSFVAIYTLEISAAGFVSPMPPMIHTEIYHKDDSSESMSINALLLFAFYYLNEEVAEIIIHGWQQYLFEKGWLNMLDCVGILAAFGAYTTMQISSVNQPTSWGTSYLKYSYRTGMYAQTAAQQSFQIWLAAACFLLWFKALKFTCNVPVMASIGNTFSKSINKILMFVVVMGALFMAYGTAFNILLCTKMASYGSFWNTMEQIVINGLMGAMDYETIAVNLPHVGPIIYSSYLFSVLFVGFTILISIIADSYEDAKNEPVKDGMITTPPPISFV